MEKLRAEKQDILIKIHADCSNPSHPALVSPGREENLFFFFPVDFVNTEEERLTR